MFVCECTYPKEVPFLPSPYFRLIWGVKGGRGGGREGREGGPCEHRDPLCHAHHQPNVPTENCMCMHFRECRDESE